MNASESEIQYMPQNMPHLMMWFGGEIPTQQKISGGGVRDYVKILEDRAKKISRA